MNKKEIVAYLAEELGYTKVDVERIIEQQNIILELLSIIMKEKGVEKLRLGDLILEMKKSKARDYINPKTKEQMEIKEKINVKVKYKRKKKYGSGSKEEK